MATTTTNNVHAPAEAPCHLNWSDWDLDAEAEEAAAAAPAADVNCNEHVDNVQGVGLFEGRLDRCCEDMLELTAVQLQHERLHVGVVRRCEHHEERLKSLEKRLKTMDARYSEAVVELEDRLLAVEQLQKEQVERNT